MTASYELRTYTPTVLENVVYLDRKQLRTFIGGQIEFKITEFPSIARFEDRFGGFSVFRARYVVFKSNQPYIDCSECLRLIRDVITMRFPNYFDIFDACNLCCERLDKFIIGWRLWPASRKDERQSEEKDDANPFHGTPPRLIE
jgi:hypothetical protein